MKKRQNKYSPQNVIPLGVSIVPSMNPYFNGVVCGEHVLIMARCIQYRVGFNLLSLYSVAVHCYTPINLLEYMSCSSRLCKGTLLCTPLILILSLKYKMNYIFKKGKEKMREQHFHPQA